MARQQRLQTRHIGPGSSTADADITEGSAQEGQEGLIQLMSVVMVEVHYAASAENMMASVPQPQQMFVAQLCATLDTAVVHAPCYHSSVNTCRLLCNPAVSSHTSLSLLYTSTSTKND
jgi:hypothetical protein